MVFCHRSLSDSISIHSLRMEGDIALFDFGISEKISIHSLRMEGDYFSSAPCAPPQAFQSTPSAWRETWQFQSTGISHGISIHSLRMEGDDCGYMGNLHHDVISIHSLRMEGDSRGEMYAEVDRDFNPLPPHGGRQEEALARTADCNISIHSLRMEGDDLMFRRPELLKLFQSTPSAWRETGKSRWIGIATKSFQSTPSAWRETL